MKSIQNQGMYCLEHSKAIPNVPHCEGITIGFTRERESVREDTPGSVLLTARLLVGEIQGRTVLVSYSTPMSSGNRTATSE